MQSSNPTLASFINADHQSYRSYRAAGVLCYIVPSTGEPEFLLRQQAKKKGADPELYLCDLGGKIEKSDAGVPCVTAAREFLEEISGEVSPSEDAIRSTASTLHDVATDLPQSVMWIPDAKYVCYALELETRLIASPLANCIWMSATEFREAMRLRRLHPRLRSANRLIHSLIDDVVQSSMTSSGSDSYDALNVHIDLPEGGPLVLKPLRYHALFLNEDALQRSEQLADDTAAPLRSSGCSETFDGDQQPLDANTLQESDDSCVSRMAL
eukprot:NODE_1322_length_966_cov_280.339149_g1017_i0.p1 GENE.NODE_1322_length_966_cov_280.339149_g1017_i0~~NODE_1322_length_966_cov_280.339149_g1017_i0.p1  ORF type:complete len:289 (-),score=63.94 NODE_1322_length_966_cov_280.339149_g1017_i0:98-904(-)